MVLRRHHEFDDGLSEEAAQPCFLKTALRQCGTLFLVVASPWVIHSIVKPQRELHCCRLPGQMSGLIELRQALRDVLLVVIMALWFGVSSRQSLIRSGRSGGGTGR